MNEQRVLPAKVYDALHLSAEMYGGIGARDMVASRRNTNLRRRDQEVPVCYVGHLWCAGIQRGHPYLQRDVFGITYGENDRAVMAINWRSGARGDDALSRVPFEQWCAELGVVRGPEPVSLWLRLANLWHRGETPDVRDRGNAGEVPATVAARIPELIQ